MTQIILQQSNMVGAQMIGIYANHNAHHALMQHTNLRINPEYGGFTLNGKPAVSLSDAQDSNGRYVSKSTSGFVGASVDNAKDPVLGDLNQNGFTADASMMLARAKFNSDEIGIMMTQPIVMDITRAYQRESRKGKSKDDIIADVIKSYKDKAAKFGSTLKIDYTLNSFRMEDLYKAIIIEKDMASIESVKDTDDGDKQAFYDF